MYKIFLDIIKLIIHTYFSRFIPERVKEAPEKFLQIPHIANISLLCGIQILNVIGGKTNTVASYNQSQV
jgi:hypothetical protein